MQVRRLISVQCGSLRFIEHAPAPATKGAYLSDLIWSLYYLCVCKRERWKAGFWWRVGWGVQAAASLWGAHPHTETKTLFLLRLSWKRFGVFAVLGLSQQCPSDTNKTINLLCLGRNNISNPLLVFFESLWCLSWPPLKPDSHPLQCGCSGSFPGKPVDYPYCFMAKSYPTITVLCHWEIAYSQTCTLRHTPTHTLAT